MLGTRGPVTHQTTTATRGTKSSPPIDLAALTDQQLAIHAQGLCARLDTGYVKCEQAPDADTRWRWENAWLGLLGEYERAIDEMRRRGVGE
ncbi:MAG: hypothetical protein ACTHMJ_20900 [Thermomicrobiales bacterium]